VGPSLLDFSSADVRLRTPQPLPGPQRLPGQQPRGLRARSASAGIVTAPEVRFAVRLTPRAGTDRVDGVVEGVLRARVSAPAIEGAANQALLRLLATELGVSRSSVRLVAGAAGRQKLVVVDGIEPDEVRARWPELAV
jgi:uncharacterized protein YggU (UPF0235/DUF167 family)